MKSLIDLVFSIQEKGRIKFTIPAGLALSLVRSVKSVLSLSVLLSSGLSLPLAYADTSKPHILLIVADDMGWNDVGYHGSEIKTPNIDMIAGKGIELDRFYVQPSCSPTRASLLTGKSAVTLGVYSPLNSSIKIGVPLDEKLMPEYLADLGYQRFMVGKWHLGKQTRSQLPNARGFDHFYGSLSGGVGHWNKVHAGRYDWQRNGKTLREEGYYSHLLVREVQTLIEKRDVNKPTFTYVAFQAPHLPGEAPQETIDKYDIENTNRKLHAAMVDELDQSVGEILEIYQSAGLLDNTIVMFTSDNGGLIPPNVDPEKQTSREQLFTWMVKNMERPLGGSYVPGLEWISRSTLEGGSDNGSLTGGKGSISEGGVRVPAAIWWPGVLENGLHQQFMSVEDVLPTLLDAVGAAKDISAGISGRSRLDALLGRAHSERSSHYLIAGLSGDFAIYRWPWKYSEQDGPSLYNVKIDPTEQSNLAQDHKQIAIELRAIMTDWSYGPKTPRSFYDMLFDPYFFGGEETKQPAWSDLVEED